MVVGGCSMGSAHDKKTNHIASSWRFDHKVSVLHLDETGIDNSYWEEVYQQKNIEGVYRLELEKKLAEKFAYLKEVRASNSSGQKPGGRLVN